MKPSLLFAIFVGLSIIPLPFTAHAIPSTITGCPGSQCTVTPIAGPILLDPVDFTLDVTWAPQHIELTQNDFNPDWRVQLFFTFTGMHDGTENIGGLTLTDELGAALPLNEQFDDINVNFMAGTFVANFEIFNPGPFDPAAPPFFAHGFTLSSSDGSGVDTLQWISSEFSPAEQGIWTSTVPEPSTLLLFASGLIGLCAWRYRKIANN